MRKALSILVVICILLSFGLPVSAKAASVVRSQTVTLSANWHQGDYMNPDENYMYTDIYLYGESELGYYSVYVFFETFVGLDDYDSPVFKYQSYYASLESSALKIINRKSFMVYVDATSDFYCSTWYSDGREEDGQIVSSHIAIHFTAFSPIYSTTTFTRDRSAEGFIITKSIYQHCFGTSSAAFGDISFEPEVYADPYEDDQKTNDQFSMTTNFMNFID